MNATLNGVQFLAQLNIPSRERRSGPASKSELRRWFDAGNVVANAERVEWNEPMDFHIISYVLFPKGQRVTLW